MKEAFAILVIVVILFALPVGWVLNLIHLVGSDFKAPYKNEIVRTIGVVVPPVGMVAGYVHINDQPEEN